MPYLIFDIESSPDVERILASEDAKARESKIDPNRLETRDEVAARVLEGLCKEPNCMPPTRFHVPNTIVALLVNDQLQYITHAAFAARNAKGVDWEANTKGFWDAYNWAQTSYAGGVTLVGFNSMKFDMPVAEICGLAAKLNMSNWFKLGGGTPSYKDPRSRFATALHLDLYYYLNNGGSIGGSLSYWSRLAGLPGKLGTNGGAVAELLKVPSGAELLIDYCSCDVMNTYGLLYRLLYTAGLVATDWKGDVFNDTMAKVFAGRGAECTAFVNFIKADGLF